jgi:TIR domain
MYLARYDTSNEPVVQGALVFAAPPPDQDLLRKELIQVMAPVLDTLETRRDVATVVVRPIGGRRCALTLFVSMPASEEAVLRGQLLRLHQIGQEFPVTCSAVSSREDFDVDAGRACGSAAEVTNAPEIREDVRFFPAYHCIDQLAQITEQIGKLGDQAMLCWRIAAVEPRHWEKNIRTNLVRMARHWIPEPVRAQQEKIAARFLEHGLLADQFFVAPDSTARDRINTVLRRTLCNTAANMGFSDTGIAEVEEFAPEMLGVEWLASPIGADEPYLGKAVERGILTRLLFEPVPAGRFVSKAVMRPSSPVRVFVSYAHEDAEFAHQLNVSCAQLRRDGWVQLWSDAEILPGESWREEIHQALESADLIVLLISPDFTQSDFCFSIEMRRALERQAQGEAHVVPIVVRWTDTGDAPFAQLQQLPSARKPVSSWTDRDAAWLDVVVGLRRLLQNAYASE